LMESEWKAAMPASEGTAQTLARSIFAELLTLR